MKCKDTVNYKYKCLETDGTGQLFRMVNPHQQCFSVGYNDMAVHNANELHTKHGNRTQNYENNETA